MMLMMIMANMVMMMMTNLSSSMWAWISKVGLLIIIFPFAALLIIIIIIIISAQFTLLGPGIKMISGHHAFNQDNINFSMFSKGWRLLGFFCSNWSQGGLTEINELR